VTEFSSPADLFAFAVIFFPGFVSLSIAMRLHDVHADKLGAVEKVVLSFALSVASFFIAGVPLDPLAPSKSVLSFTNLTIVFLVAIGLGLVIAIFYYAWIYVEFHIIGVADWIRVKLGLTLSPGTTLNDALDVFWDYRDKSYVVVMDKDGQKYRGFLGMVSFEPTIQLALSRHNNKNPEKFEKDEWNSVDEWILVFAEDNIRWIGAAAI
jgi:hypothetical protein